MLTQIELLPPEPRLRHSWERVATSAPHPTQFLMRAAETGKRRDVEAATAQMERALRVEGWL